MVNYCRTCEKQLMYGDKHPDHEVYDLDELRNTSITIEVLYQEIQKEIQKKSSFISLYIKLLMDANLDHYAFLDFIKKSRKKKYKELYQINRKKIEEIGMPSFLYIHQTLEFIAELVSDYIKN